MRLNEDGIKLFRVNNSKEGSNDATQSWKPSEEF